MALNRNVILGLAAATITATTVFAASHDSGPAENAIKARKAHMQLYAHNLGTLGAMAKGGMEYDAAAAQGAADNLVALATMNQMSYWVPDSSSMDSDNSRALPELWDKIPDAMAKGEALAAAAMAMQAAAGSLEGVQGAMGPLGGACGGCHKAYRQPDS